MSQMSAAAARRRRAADLAVMDVGPEVPWLAPTYGRRLDIIRLNRWPRDLRERTWVYDILPTRLRPGGELRGPDGTVVHRVPRV